jgi:hypothetical protein
LALTHDSTLKILREFLQTAVPLWVIRFKDLPWEELQQVMKESEKILEESGELAVFATVKKGETAKAFNAVARAIAALSFVPGGIDIFNLHFETKHEGPTMGRSTRAIRDWFPKGKDKVPSDAFDEFMRSYVEAALWSSTDEKGVPLDKNYVAEDIAQETLDTLAEDARDFMKRNWKDIMDNPAGAGHDFWLTRNHHGAGFWDGDWPDKVGKRLTDKSHAYGSFDLYVGDDGKIHGE